MKPRTLIYDIETSPILGTTWGLYDQNVVWVIKDWYILSFAYKWLGEKKTHIVAVNDFPKQYKKDPDNDIEVLKVLHRLFSEADIVIAHNGNSFDQKKVNARFIQHGMNPPEPYKQIDTKLVAKRYFNFTSNKLDDLGKYLGLGRKLQTGGYELWRQCLAGDKKAWDKMKRYNKQDVILLEKVYLKLRPWIENHPAINLLSETFDTCPKCGSNNLQKRGKQVNKSTVYQRYQCQSCGGWLRSRTADKLLNQVQYIN